MSEIIFLNPFVDASEEDRLDLLNELLRTKQISIDQFEYEIEEILLDSRPNPLLPKEVQH